MADLSIIYWRDIPAQVVVRQGRASAKRELSLRFTEAIDRAAMRSGAKDSDAYLAAWRRSGPDAVDGDPDTAADAAAARIEGAYDEARLRALVLNGGTEP